MAALILLERFSMDALLTDIGNDILFGSNPEQILQQVEWCIEQLQNHSAAFVELICRWLRLRICPNGVIRSIAIFFIRSADCPK